MYLRKFFSFVAVASKEPTSITSNKCYVAPEESTHEQPR